MAPAPGEIFLDGTTGAGGHAAEIAARIGPRGLLVCADADPSMLEIAAPRLSDFPWVRLVRADFADLDALRETAGGRTFDGALLDLGISSLQLDDPARGFSFRVEGPLDMRRDPDGGGPTAAEILRDTREKDLADLFFRFGEERFSRRIARAVVERRKRDPIRTTTGLADLVSSAIPRRAWPRDIHPATRVFQALRIAVNRELSSLGAFLEAIPGHLSPGGRVAVISFHSLEDRMVKTAFRSSASGPGEEEPMLERLTRKPVVPSEREARENPRARSAKLRVARRRDGGDGHEKDTRWKRRVHDHGDPEGAPGGPCGPQTARVRRPVPGPSRHRPVQRLVVGPVHTDGVPGFLRPGGEAHPSEGAGGSPSAGAGAEEPRPHPRHRPERPAHGAGADGPGDPVR